MSITDPSTRAMTAPSYFLSPSVHWCVVNGHCIILNIETDQYLQIPPDIFLSLLPYVDANLEQIANCAGGPLPTRLSTVAEELAKAKVLLRTPSSSKREQIPQLPRPARLVSRPADKISRTALIRALPYFITACTVADYRLRNSSLSRISAQVSARRTLAASRLIDNPLDQAIGLTHIYHILRPLYPRNYLCLFDCLALLGFLAHWNIFPYWVFGVSADPFEAHCWLQQGHTVLSDTVTFSSRWFSTIMIL